jgi:hypothetical protein
MSDRTAQHTPPAAPPRYKLALLSWAGAYGMITLIFWLLGPTIARWPLMLRTLLISVLMVTALTWIVLPALRRLFRAWLLAATPTPVQGAQTPAVVVDDTTGDRSARRPVPSTCAPGSRSWARSSGRPAAGGLVRRWSTSASGPRASLRWTGWTRWRGGLVRQRMLREASRDEEVLIRAYAGRAS